MKVSLTPELEKLVKAKVASGLYDSPSEVVRDAVRQLHFQHLTSEQRLRMLQREIKRGMDQIRRGAYSEYSRDSLTQLKSDVRHLALQRFRRKAG